MVGADGAAFVVTGTEVGVVTVGVRSGDGVVVGVVGVVAISISATTHSTQLMIITEDNNNT